MLALTPSQAGAYGTDGGGDTWSSTQGCIPKRLLGRPAKRLAALLGMEVTGDALFLSLPDLFIGHPSLSHIHAITT